MTILYEKNTEFRQIFTDGRPLPEDPHPSFNGYSSGKWDGDTLVVETIGFRDDLWLDEDGNPMTDAARITERFRRPNFGNMEIEVTVNDPKAYTAPWTITTLDHQIECRPNGILLPGERAGYSPHGRQVKPISRLFRRPEESPNVARPL
jgi:hypothetical protein